MICPAALMMDRTSLEEFLTCRMTSPQEPGQDKTDPVPYSSAGHGDVIGDAGVPAILDRRKARRNFPANARRRYCASVAAAPRAASGLS